MMHLFSAFFFPSLLGYLTAVRLISKDTFPERPILLLAISFPLGLGLCSLILFFTYWIAPSQGGFFSAMIPLAVISILLAQTMSRAPENTRRTRGFSPLATLQKEHSDLSEAFHHNKPLFFQKIVRTASYLLLAVVLFFTLRFYSLAVSLDIFGGWDAKFIWIFKAKFFFRDPELWQAMFSPKLHWAHPDYPLLLPASIAWGWHWLGHESLFWGPLISLGFYLSCGLILFWYLKVYISPTAACFGGAFFLLLQPFLYWSAQQLADVVLSYFITASGLTWLTALRSKNTKALILPGLLGGLAAWTKNEGCLFLFWICLLNTATEAIRHKTHLREAGVRLFWFFAGISVPALAILLLKCCLGNHGDVMWSQWEPGNISWDARRFFSVLRASYIYMTSFAMWHGLWVLAGLAMVAAFFKKDPHGRYLLGLIFLINFGYGIMLYLTPYFLHFQIRTASDRLLLHSSILAIAFSFETFLSWRTRRETL